MANSLSKKISIFPISFDRSKGSSYTYCERNTESVTETDANNSDLLSYISENLIIAKTLYDNLDEAYKYYYTPVINSSLSDNYANGRILSEKNISALIRSLTDKEFFVVNSDFNSDKTACNYVEFVIRGRYFALDLTDNIIIDNTKELWVKVSYLNEYKINDPANEDEYEMLDAFDAKITPKIETEPSYSILAGVDFYHTDHPADAYQILELVDNKLRIPTDSQFKFTSRSIENINGGIV